MGKTKITPMAERKYEMIPISSVKILNSRNRDRLQFEQNIRSIKTVGLLKPVVINARRFEKTGYYELVCGEGRYLAYKALKYPDTRCIRVPGHLGTRQLGNLGTRVPVHPTTQAPGYPSTQVPGYPGTQVSKYPSTRLFGYPGIQAPGNSGTRVPGLSEHIRKPGGSCLQCEK